ncbi:type I secretion system permease/ATPase [Candidatus Bandiella numerosa]|uniref:type I secretion system permease/ATPase n=1 Tax=Candidatus Bandiella numerosa TaxID=2570586 RepID=UPI00249E31F4|nr:type I secretion system permease/ATPase [Candidatus Bandiella numerosa]WHA05276.1 type I secretion system permease/ATPase [Candidatus Bandiella numerosa]
MKNSNEISNNPLRDALLSCKVMVKFVLLFGCLINLLMLSTPLFSMQVLDRVLGSQNTDTLLMLTLVIILALALLGLIQAARAFAMNKMGSWLEDKLSEVVFSNSIKLALESKAMANSQQLRDLQTVKTFLTSPGLISIMDMPWAIIFIIVLFILHTSIGFLALISGVILIVFGIIADRSTKPLIEMNNGNFIKSMRQVDQSTRNAEVIEVMGMKNNIISSWQKMNQEVQQTQNLVTKRQAIFMEITKFFRLVIQISVTALGAYLVIQGQITSGTIIASSSLVGRALAPFEAAINSWKGFITCRQSYERLAKSFNRYSSDSDRMSLPEPEGEIEVENVYHAPQGVPKHILKGINFSLNKGEVLAIIGPSASGKTTLAKLLVGIANPSIGTIRIDKASLKDWKKEELGPHIGYLPQDVELFFGTVKENIARMHSDPHYEDVVIAAQLAGVHDMILQLPQGYDTNVGLDGSMLSGGQKQRIGLARTFYGTPKFIVLDEPNASLDTQGEEALMTAISVAKEKEITTIIISHKTSILSIVDKILVMKDGMVASFGPKKDVMAKLKEAQSVGKASIGA